MTWTDAEVWRFAGAVVVGILAVALFKDDPREPSGRAGAFLALTVAGHLLLPLLLRRDVPIPVVHAALLLSLSVPFAFWRMSQVHFRDDFEPRPWHLGMLAGLLAVGYVAWLAAVERRLSPRLFPPQHLRFWLLAPKLLALAVVLHALLAIHAGARSDLVLPRLKTRYGVLLVSGTYILLVLLGEAFFTGSDSEALADRVHSLAVLALLVAVAVVSLRIRPDLLKAARPALEAQALDPALAEKLRRLVEVDQVYREEGLTIGTLAERLGAQEYKVRQLINAELGFRNFNAFLHHFRIRDAQAGLADPARAHLGVAQVAYEVGYRSLATFNRAFKELTGRTPTEFRASRQPAAASPRSAD